ncbi:MAG: enediyne biosynthesis protein [Actinomycetota bacterium]|jgi:hypothetical protein|nr:enediyne biosynthesis protein [Actinomycetota bacterium]
MLPAVAAPEDLPYAVLSAKSTSLPLGAPLKVAAELHNPSFERLLDFIFHVKNEAGEEVPFDNWTNPLPADGTATTTVEATTAQWFPEPGRYTMFVTESGNPAGKPLHFTVTRAAVTVPRFKDITASVGLTSQNPDYTCGRWLVGTAWGDTDGDGDLDLYVPHPDRDAQLMINDGAGGFDDLASGYGVTNHGSVGIGASFADYDNDGDEDLYITNDGPDRLYRNDGTGSFEDVTGAAGISDNLNGTSMAWGDYDNDGFLDLYVANYAHCTGTELKPLEYHLDKLWHNEGDGTFTDQTALVEHDPATRADGSTIGAAFTVIWIDYDNDGDQDIYLGNDFWNRDPDKNHLWRNDGANADGTWQFTDVSTGSRAGVIMNSMGIAPSDYDRDGDTDMALSDIEKNRLFQNEGDGTFTDIGKRVGIARNEQRVALKTITWGMGFYDFNLDKWEDLFVAAGPLRDFPDPQANEMFVADGRKKFYDLSAPSGATDTNAISKGTAFADFDRDGRMDILIANNLDTIKLWRNITKYHGAHWLELDLEGTVSNRDACGARVNAFVAGDKLPIPRTVMCSVGTASGSDKVLHFGLGQAGSVRKIVVQWPSGIKQVITNVKADKLVKLKEESV